MKGGGSRSWDAGLRPFAEKLGTMGRRVGKMNELSIVVGTQGVRLVIGLEKLLK